MVNILKSLNYTTRRNMLAVLTIISMVAVPFIISLIVIRYNKMGFGKMTGSMYMGMISVEMVILFIIAVLIFSTMLVGSDAGDKTINYEMLNGHSRGSIFWARIIAGYGWSVLLVMVLYLLPFGYFTLINGWGLSVDKAEALARLILLIFPIIRLASLFMMLTTLSGSAGRGAAYSYLEMMLVIMAGSILEEAFDMDTSYIFSTSDIAWIVTSQKSKNLVINGRNVTRLDYAVADDKAVKIIIISLVMSAIYLLIAYKVFKKKDRD